MSSARAWQRRRRGHGDRAAGRQPVGALVLSGRRRCMQEPTALTTECGLALPPVYCPRSSSRICCCLAAKAGRGPQEQVRPCRQRRRLGGRLAVRILSAPLCARLILGDAHLLRAESGCSHRAVAMSGHRQAGQVCRSRCVPLSFRPRQSVARRLKPTQP